MIHSPESTALGVERLEHALGVSTLLPAERAALLALLRMLGAADVAMREPAGDDSVARAAGVLMALLDTRISLARRSSAFSRRNRFNSADSSLVVPGRWPVSISAWRAHLRTISAVPIRASGRPR